VYNPPEKVLFSASFLYLKKKGQKVICGRDMVARGGEESDESKRPQERTFFGKNSRFSLGYSLPPIQILPN